MVSIEARVGRRAALRTARRLLPVSAEQEGAAARLGLRSVQVGARERAGLTEDLLLRRAGLRPAIETNDHPRA